MTLLETENLTKRFGELTAVDNVNLSVEQGVFHSVIGPNGAGKSTLFNLITGLLDPTDGHIYFEGDEITGLSPHEISRRGITRSFQITDVFEGLTVRENIRVAAQANDADKASLLRRAEGLDAVNQLTREIIDQVGLNDYIEMRADELGHGDRRKLEIGLAISADPRLLLLDEPTAGMDKEDTLNTMKMVRRVAQERDLTIVLIEHDLDVVMGISDVITVLHQGAVIAEGDPETIQNDPNVQSAYLGAEVGQ